MAAFISHRRGIYYALLTIAFGQVFWFIAIKWHSVTGGEDGLLGIPRPPLDLGVLEIEPRQQRGALLLRAWRCSRWSLLFLWRLRAFAVRPRAARRSSGTRARRASSATTSGATSCTSFVLSAGLAGLAGALFAMAQQSAYPNVMSLHNSGFVVMMVLIGGGLVSFWGPVIGAAFFILARDLLGAYTESLAAVVRAAVHGDGAVPARGHRRGLAACAAPDRMLRPVTGGG